MIMLFITPLWSIVILVAAIMVEYWSHQSLPPSSLLENLTLTFFHNHRLITSPANLGQNHLVRDGIQQKRPFKCKILLDIPGPFWRVPLSNEQGGKVVVGLHCAWTDRTGIWHGQKLQNLQDVVAMYHGFSGQNKRCKMKGSRHNRAINYITCFKELFLCIYILLINA